MHIKCGHSWPIVNGEHAVQERHERLRWRTANARAERHARVLSRHWQTSTGLVWQDMLIIAAFLAGTVCAGALVRPMPKPPDASST